MASYYSDHSIRAQEIYIRVYALAISRSISITNKDADKIASQAVKDFLKVFPNLEDDCG